MENLSHRIEGIRKWLKSNDLNALIIPHDDEYLSEYIPPENERLAWVSGFTGSAGIAIITNDIAAIFVDGRYTVQVKQQVDEHIFKILHLINNPFLKWIKDNLPPGVRLGLDSRLHRVNWMKMANKSFEKHAELIMIHHNPIDLLWDSRPQGSTDKAILLDEKYTGKSSELKRQELGKIIAKKLANFGEKDSFSNEDLFQHPYWP